LPWENVPDVVPSSLGFCKLANSRPMLNSSFSWTTGGGTGGAATFAGGGIAAGSGAVNFGGFVATFALGLFGSFGFGIAVVAAAMG
jgi:hypothetical protein